MSFFILFRIIGVFIFGLVLFSVTIVPITIAQGSSPDWRKVDSPISVALHDVAIVNHNEAWAVGEEGTILHYLNGQWQIFNSPVTTTLLCLSIVSADSVWAIDVENNVLHFDGIEWSTTALTEGLSLDIVDMMSDNAGWMADGSDALYYDGNIWATTTISSNAFFLQWRDLEMLASDNGWLVGEDAFYSNFNGVIAHYDGTQWSEFQLGSGWGSFFFGVSGLATDDVWVVGRAGGGDNSGIIMHYTGATFQTISTTARSVLDIQMLAANEGWAVDNGGGIYYYDGTWQQVTRPITDILYSIAMASDNSYGWIVGENGTILRYGYTNYIPIILK